MKGCITSMKKILCITVLGCFLLSLSHTYALAYIEGPDEVLIPNAGQSIVEYKVQQDYTFEPISQSGITLTTDGQLVLSKEASPQTLIIFATNGNESINRSITLQYSWSKQNPEFEKYQIKDTIQPLSTLDTVTNPTYHNAIKYGTLTIGALILLGYVKKRKEHT